MLEAVETMSFCGKYASQERKRWVFRVALHILIFAGLRKKEVYDLRVQDIDMVNRQIFIRLGKGNKSGYVKPPAELWPVLEGYLAQRPAFPSDILLVYSEKAPMGGCGVTRIFERILHAAGLQDMPITPHCLRHAFAMRGINAGVDIKTVQEQMRHTHIATTYRYMVSRAKVTEEKAQAFGRTNLMADTDPQIQSAPPAEAVVPPNPVEAPTLQREVAPARPALRRESVPMSEDMALPGSREQRFIRIVRRAA